MKRVHEGKKPFYLKKSAQKTLELVDKCVPVRTVCLRFRPASSRPRTNRRFEELRNTGKLGAFMEKRRKKLEKKDHKFIPFQRRS